MDEAQSGVASTTGKKRELCLVVDEMAIEYCLTLCRDVLASVGNGARSVVACRARKEQKAQMLQLIRESVPESCCLAIGDGANDVAMIKAGQIGVGIIGKEGMAAVNASDFAIGQFRFLRGLLLVHGRSVYRRMGFFNYYVLYKGTCIAHSCFLYCTTLALGSPVSQGIYLELFYDTAYAIAFTFFHVLVTAINDQDVPKNVAANTPELYTPGSRRLHFNLVGFFWWSAEALWTGIVAIYVPVFVVKAEHGGYYDDGRFAISWLSMWMITFSVTVRMWAEINSWTFMEFGSNAFSILLFVGFGVVASTSTPPTTSSFSWDPFADFIPRFFPDFEWWLALLIGILLISLPVMTARGYRTVTRPPPPGRSVPKPAKQKTNLQKGPRRTTMAPMAVPPEEEIVKEGRVQAQRNSVAAPASDSASERQSGMEPKGKGQPKRMSKAHTGFAFSSNDGASQALWEMQNHPMQRNFTKSRSSRSLAPVRSSAALATSEGSVGSQPSELSTQTSAGRKDLDTMSASASAGDSGAGDSGAGDSGGDAT